MKSRAYVLQIALFATGLSGVVAEYILATLATYFLGNSVFQWTLIISLMLFCMGIGSRFTKYLTKNLFVWFIGIEFLLSLVVSYSALSSYRLAGYYDYNGVWIYGMAILTGILIGMELPLAVRLNDRYEALATNISNILEKDYYGSLFGGLFFAFVGLPYLGLTYTPFVLGTVNLLVAIGLLNIFPEVLAPRRRTMLNLVAVGVMSMMLWGVVNAEKIVLHGEQKKYLDKVVYSEQTAYQKIVLTAWKDHHWLYLNGNLQFSSFDEPLYHEVLVHPAVCLAKHPQNVLIMGGGDGCAARELLKYEAVEKIHIVDLDPAMTRLAKEHEILTSINEGALDNPRVTVTNADAFQFLKEDFNFYDLIIVDLPDPRSIELSRLYSYEFYRLCYNHLRPNGVMITQAGSPYFASASYRCIDRTMAHAGFQTLPLHNQIITMGEWGWILGTKADTSTLQIKHRLENIGLDSVPTKWLNRSAINLITSFGKNYFDQGVDSIGINRIHTPILPKYYRDGHWSVY